MLGLIILGYTGHYRLVRMPQKVEQKDKQYKQEDKIGNIEETLVAHGYMKEPKKKNKKARGRMVKKETRREKKEREQEEQEQKYLTK